jgi:hypothetical protein
MDAVEYVKQRERMCSYYGSCDKCLANKVMGCASLIKISQMVPIVEQWAKEHPVKTRQSEFLKMFPNASVGYNGTLVICPSQADTKAVAECVRSERNCDKCKRDFWLKEIE